MKKIIKLSESDLKKIIKKVLMEQRLSNPNIQYSDTPASMTSGLISVRNKNIKKPIPLIPSMKIGFKNLVNILYTTRNSSWGEGVAKTLFNNVTDINNLAIAIILWASKRPNYNPKLLKVAIATLFRESKGSPSMVFLQPKEILGYMLNIFGGDHSQGYAQIKPSTAKKYGIKEKDLYTYSGSLEAVYKMMNQNYLSAQKFYKGSTVTIYENGKLVQKPAIGDDAALHMAIASHNAGPGIIGEWCQTNINGIANKCNIKSRVPDNTKPNVVAVTDTNKKIPNYFPNIGGVHKYMPQFKISYDNLTSLPDKVNQINNDKNKGQTITKLTPNSNKTK